MIDELKEDFQRWWVTSNFQDKMQLAIVVAIILQVLMMPVLALLSGGNND